MDVSGISYVCEFLCILKFHSISLSQCTSTCGMFESLKIGFWLTSLALSCSHLPLEGLAGTQGVVCVQYCVQLLHFKADMGLFKRLPKTVLNSLPTINEDEELKADYFPPLLPVTPVFRKPRAGHRDSRVSNDRKLPRELCDSIIASFNGTGKPPRKRKYAQGIFNRYRLVLLGLFFHLFVGSFCYWLMDNEICKDLPPSFTMILLIPARTHIYLQSKEITRTCLMNC